jgi:hypothetical protein
MAKDWQRLETTMRESIRKGERYSPETMKFFGEEYSGDDPTHWVRSDNVLGQIPGEIFGSAGYALPPAETAIENTERGIVELLDGRRGEVTFVRLKSKKGKTTRGFWTAESAVLLNDRC